jgi:hypothetical protein
MNLTCPQGPVGGFHESTLAVRWWNLPTLAFTPHTAASQAPYGLSIQPTAMRQSGKFTLPMKPKTKFKRALLSLAHKFGIAIEVADNMSGYESKTRTGWETLSLKTDKELPDEMMGEIKKLNGQTFSAKHGMTGLPSSYIIAVRNFNIAGKRFVLDASNSLIPVI